MFRLVDQGLVSEIQQLLNVNSTFRQARAGLNLKYKNPCAVDDRVCSTIWGRGCSKSFLKAWSGATMTERQASALGMKELWLWLGVVKGNQSKRKGPCVGWLGDWLLVSQVGHGQSGKQLKP